MEQLRDRVAVVTGGATGIGEAIARLFAREGARVVIADIDEDRGKSVADAVAGSFYCLDVSNEDQWTTLLTSINQHYGRLDILINNAAMFEPNVPFLDMSLDLWRKHLSTNTDSVFLGCKLGIAAMKGRGTGSIINMSSTIGLMAMPTAAAYAISKAATLMITRIAAQVGGPLGIRVNAILPGAVLTDQLRKNVRSGQTIQQFVEEIIPLYPLGRLATVSEIANAALFLASDQSSFVSGALLRVDGAQDP